MADRTNTRGQRRFLCVGLPDTGKTTFLVALYHVVESGEVPGSLRLQEGKLFEVDRAYIQSQRERWLDYKQVVRNKVDRKDPIALTLIDSEAPGDPIQLDLPDLSGETFRVQVEERVMPNSFLERLKESDGLLLFVNPATVSEPTSIVEADRSLDGVAEDDHADGADDEAEGDDEPQPSEKFSPAKCCTAAKIVELLQFWRPYLRRRPMPLVVVVSALDVLDVTPHKNEPARYVADKLALVDQYLRANADVFTYVVCGVSAQGVSYNDAAGLALVAGEGAAATRIRVRPEPPSGGHDVTSMIRWLMSQ